MFPFPKLGDSEVAIAQVEAQTGIPLNVNGQRHRANGGEVYRIFATLTDARAYARRAVAENPAIECALFNYAGRGIETIRSPRP